MAIVVSQVGQGHLYIDYVGRSFKRSAEQLSHVTERERLAQEAVRESQDPGRDADHEINEPELPQQPSQSSEHEPNVASVPEQPDVSMPDLGSPETPREPAETSDDDHDEQTTAGAARHIGNGDLSTQCLLQNLMVLWRRDDELLQKDLQLLVTAEEEDVRQKRMKSESVPELFPL